MDFPKAQRYQVRVSEKYFLTENQHFLYVKFELVEPNHIDFLAGQYVSLAVSASGERRSYSIATTPDNTHGFALVAEMVPAGKGSLFLQQIPIGGEVEILGPLGRFVVDETENKLLFVATGSGIVPIYSMINDLLLNTHDHRQIRLHWGLRNEANMFWFDNFERLMENYPNFVFDPVLSQPSESWSLCRGHVQDCLRRDFSNGIVGWSGYVCGNPGMVEEVTGVLTELGMPIELVHHEKFS